MVTYRVAPGYGCTPEDFKLILDRLAELRDLPMPIRALPVVSDNLCLHEMYHCVLTGWCSESDKLAVVVYPDEPCIRLNCSGGGIARDAKELHRKAIIGELWRFSMARRINLQITSA